MVPLMKRMQDADGRAVCALEDICETELFTIKLPVLYFMCEALEKCESVSLLDKFVLELSNVVLRRSYCGQSIARESITRGTL